MPPTPVRPLAVSSFPAVSPSTTQVTAVKTRAARRGRSTGLMGQLSSGGMVRTCQALWVRQTALCGVTRGAIMRPNRVFR